MNLCQPVRADLPKARLMPSAVLAPCNQALTERRMASLSIEYVLPTPGA